MPTRNPKLLKFPSFTAKPKSQEELAELNLGTAARSLSDDLVESDPAVISAAAAADAWATRMERLATYPGKRNVILKLVDGIAAELELARQAYRFACLDSFLAKDHEFKAAIAAQEHVTLLESRLQAAKTARLDLERNFTELGELRSLQDMAISELGNTRFELKRRAVLAQQQQPESV